MKKTLLMMTIALMPLASHGQEAAPDYVKEKEILLQKVCRYYEKRDDTSYESAKAQMALLAFKRDLAKDKAEKVRLQKELVENLKKQADKLDKLFEAGETPVIDAYKTRLLLLDAREALRLLEQ